LARQRRQDLSSGRLIPAGEKPSEAQLRDIEDELCAAIGLADHQRISAVHTNTDHLHIHIAINKVHAVTRRCVEPYYDKHKLMAACDRLEIKHGLERTRHGKRQEEKMRGRGADMEAHSGQEALSSWIRTHALTDIQACLRGGQSWQDLHAVLASYDLEIRPRGAGLVLATADGIMVRASRVLTGALDGSAEQALGHLCRSNGTKAGREIAL
jgi:hypothetical protein